MKTGIIINNVGTPKNPSPQAVGEYLKEFLMDKEIIPLPWILRYILVHFIIVPKRKYDSSKKYQSIWGKNKSPLLEYSESFLEKLQVQLGQQYIVKLGMCFGSPSIEQAVIDIVKAQVDKILFVPMYPQKARATTVAATNLFRKYIKKHNFSGVIESFSPFYKEEAFVENSVRMLQADLALCKYDHVLFSFHGLPDTPIAQEYKEQCIATADFISRRAGLKKDFYSVSFQSRLGPKKWLTPYTSEVAIALAAEGCKR
ncbi:MAG: ferrochelatase, partial [Pseudobdellovibrio sp.]